MMDLEYIANHGAAMMILFRQITGCIQSNIQLRCMCIRLASSAGLLCSLLLLLESFRIQQTRVDMK